jgi:hypothetical protein
LDPILKAERKKKTFFKGALREDSKKTHKISSDTGIDAGIFARTRSSIRNDANVVCDVVINV